MISPELQRTAIEDHCTRRGYRIVEWVEGIDESGSRRGSAWWARLNSAVGMVEQGAADVLVVWRFSRAARQRLRWAVAIDRVEVAGGLLESATEPLDTSTASGRLARGMLAEFAAYEAETIGNTWRETHARRTKAGLPANGKPRFGYTVVEGMHRPDPDTGPVLAELYRRYVGGETLWSLAAWLNRERIRTVAGYSSKGPGDWSINSLRGMLDRGFGAGLIVVHGEHQPGAHEPVIDAGTWDAYLAARALRRPLRRVERSPYVLSGLVWCGCGSKMGGGRYGKNRLAGFRCIDATRPGAPTHPAAYVPMVSVEASVRTWLAELAAEVNADADAAVAHRAKVTRRRHDAKLLERELVDVDKALTQMMVDAARQRGVMPPAVLDAARDELLAQRAALEDRLRSARAEAGSGQPARLAADLLAHWDVYDVEHRRAGLRELISRVTVTGRTVQVSPRW